MSASIEVDLEMESGTVHLGRAFIAAKRGVTTSIFSPPSARRWALGGRPRMPAGYRDRTWSCLARSSTTRCGVWKLRPRIRLEGFDRLNRSEPTTAEAGSR
ncbi:hypothetical protein ABIB27_001091 [Arthrobacter sp. UYEF21]